MKSGMPATSVMWIWPINWKISSLSGPFSGNIDGADIRIRYPETLRFNLEGVEG